MLHHTAARADLISDILIEVRVCATSNTLTPVSWLKQNNLVRGRGMRTPHWLSDSRHRNKY